MTDTIAQHAAEQIVDLANVGGTMHVNDILPIIAEACRKADNKGRIDELRGIDGTFRLDRPNAESIELDIYGWIHSRLSALSEPKKLESLTPKETKD